MYINIFDYKWNDGANLPNAEFCHPSSRLAVWLEYLVNNSTKIEIHICKPDYDIGWVELDYSYGRSAPVNKIFNIKRWAWIKSFHKNV